jgi:hypothetical protein
MTISHPSQPFPLQQEQLEISGRIAARRCHGKYLSFLTVVLENEAPDSETTAKITFRRAQFDTQKSSELPFPVKNSDMPFGAVVSVQVVLSMKKGNGYQNTYEARSWRLIGEHPRVRACERATTKEGAILCSDYLQAREEEFLRIRQIFPKPEQSRPPETPSTSQGEEKTDATVKNRHPASDPGRARVFAEWLIKNLLPAEKSFLRVLDVAGGKGQLSIALAKRGVTCTVVDPLLRSRRSLKRLEKSRTRCTTNTNDLPAFIATYFDDNVATDSLVTQYDVLCGMHPDECTESIVNLALKHQKPFAVVPCCVFPSLFTKRQLNNGRRVQSYDEFLLYLREKDPRIQQATLDIQGRNQIIYLKV